MSPVFRSESTRGLSSVALKYGRQPTGLGLTLAKRFIELHGGRIWVDSEVGNGTTFTFRIPAMAVVMG